MFSFQAWSSDLATTFTTKACRLKHCRAIRMEMKAPSLSCMRWGSMNHDVDPGQEVVKCLVVGAGAAEREESAQPLLGERTAQGHQLTTEDGEVVESLTRLYWFSCLSCRYLTTSGSTFRFLGL